jgi:hypothetical protein
MDRKVTAGELRALISIADAGIAEPGERLAQRTRHDQWRNYASIDRACFANLGSPARSTSIIK